MLKKNDKITVRIESCTSLGSGVGRYNGMTVFAANTAPGDLALLHIIKVKPNYAVGKLERLIERSDMRIEPECPVYSKCGGCAFSHIKYEDELKIKQQQIEDNFKRIAALSLKINSIIGGKSDKRYRNKAQFPVSADTSGNVQIGFYSQHSHRVTDCRECLLQPEEFRAVTDVFRKWMKLYKISAYNESTRKGLLRHIYIRKAAVTGEIMVCAVINGDSLPFRDELVFELKEAIPSLKSFIININKKDTNVVLGDKYINIFGDGYITDELCSMKFDISPQSFYQVNHDMAEVLYNKAAEYACLTGKETVLDLYCGTGTIGLTLAKKAGCVIGVEVIPQAVENAKENAQKNGITNAEFICGDAADAAKELKGRNISPDVVILDPPRKGCNRELLQTVAEFSPERIVYVSCDSATLARDCAVLAQLGYTIKELTPVDMFPRTPHVETVVLLSKGEIDSKKIRVEFSLEDMDTSGFQQGATYEQIKGRVLEQTGLKVSSLYISQIKRKCGLEVGQSYNLSKKENAKQPQCPPEKEKAIREAMKYFGMI